MNGSGQRQILTKHAHDGDDCGTLAVWLYYSNTVDGEDGRAAAWMVMVMVTVQEMAGSGSISNSNGTDVDNDRSDDVN